MEMNLKYKNDALLHLSKVESVFNALYLLAPLKKSTILPYYMGVQCALVIAAIVILAFKFIHKKPVGWFQWTGSIAPILIGVTAVLSWIFSPNSVPDFWVLKVVGMLSLIPFTIAMNKCPLEDIRDVANIYIGYIISCIIICEV